MHSRIPAGASLIEVLIAVLVLVLGALGAAGTQLAAARTRMESARMNQAVQLASTLAERMRANRAQTPAYLQLNYSADDGDPGPSAGCFDAAQCSAGQMAMADMQDIKQELHARFPGGRVRVCRDAVVWDDGQRALAWECTGGADAPLVIKLGWRGKRADGAADRDASGASAPAVAMVLP